MCQCGCEPTAVVRFRAPKARTWYVIEVYPGCTNGCGTDWGLGVTEVREGSDEWQFFEHAPVGTLNGPLRQWGTTILNTALLQTAFMESIGEADDLAEAPFALEEFIAHGGLRTTFYNSLRTPPESDSSEPTDTRGTK